MLIWLTLVYRSLKHKSTLVLSFPLIFPWVLACHHGIPGHFLQLNTEISLSNNPQIISNQLYLINKKAAETRALASLHKAQRKSEKKEGVHLKVFCLPGVCDHFNIYRDITGTLGQCNHGNRQREATQKIRGCFDQPNSEKETKKHSWVCVCIRGIVGTLV